MNLASTTVATESSSKQADLPDNRRVIDAVDAPARRLTAKRAALHARKASRAESAQQSVDELRATLTEGHVLTSLDGSLLLAIAPLNTGLWVQRRQHLPTGARTAMTMAFQDATDFSRWCNLDPLRTRDPALFEQLRLLGLELLGAVR